MSRDKAAQFWSGLRQERFLVVGAGGVSGSAIARLFRRIGVPFRLSDVTPTEQVLQLARELELEEADVLLGPQGVSQLDAVTQIVTAPGVPRSSRLLSAAQERGISVWSDFDLLYPLFADKRIAAVTGTDGKTTTTQLLGHLLESTQSTLVAGNTGTPLSAVYDRLLESEVIVLELSSFMLEQLERFRANVSTVLNLAEDHVDRYANLDEYADAKRNIVRHAQSRDVFIQNVDDQAIRDWDLAGVRVRTVSERSPADYWLDGNSLRIKTEKLARSCLQLQGQHLCFDALVAAAMAVELGLDPNLVASRLGAFVGVPHRFESVAEIGGVQLIDDSKATSIHAVRRALENLTNRSTVLILGGRDKMLDASPLRDFVSGLRAVVGYGEAGRRLLEGFPPATRVYTYSFDDAVRIACAAARRGDVLLLSPGCTSFDQHRDYRERGARFRSLARMHLTGVFPAGQDSCGHDCPTG